MAFRDYLGDFPDGPPYNPPCKIYGERCACEAYARMSPGSVVTCQMIAREEGREEALEAEQRIKDPTTGGEKGQKLARFDLVPPRPLWALAEHYGKGARKYAERNWERGYSWSLSYQAAMRHLNKFWQGEDYEFEPDPTARILIPMDHLAAAAFHIFALMEFRLTHPELDNRPGRAGGPDNIASDDELPDIPREGTIEGIP